MVHIILKTSVCPLHPSLAIVVEARRVALNESILATRFSASGRSVLLTFRQSPE